MGASRRPTASAGRAADDAARTERGAEPRRGRGRAAQPIDRERDREHVERTDHDECRRADGEHEADRGLPRRRPPCRCRWAVSGRGHDGCGGRPGEGGGRAWDAERGDDERRGEDREHELGPSSESSTAVIAAATNAAAWVAHSATTLSAVSSSTVRRGAG